MLPIDEDDEKLPIIDDNIYVSASGTVTSSSKQTTSFYMYTQQFVCGQQEDIAVRGVMNKNAKWKNPLEMVPGTNSMISFDGILDKFESYRPEKTNKKITCAVVTIQDITFLQCVEEGEMKAGKTKKVEMRERLKSRKEKKQTVEPSTPDASQSSSLPSTSQKLLGKRKATISEDEIEQVTSL